VTDQDAVMVQIVENHAEIVGVLQTSAPSADRAGFRVLTIRVGEAHTVSNWPNLFTRDVGSTLEVLAREGTPAATAQPGPIRLRVRKAGPATAFAE
jgi:hypothetical protein